MALLLAAAVFMAACRRWTGLAAGWARGVSLPLLGALHRLSARLDFALLEPLTILTAAATALTLTAGAAAALSGRAALVRRRLRQIGRAHV